MNVPATVTVQVSARYPLQVWSLREATNYYGEYCSHWKPTKSVLLEGLTDLSSLVDAMKAVPKPAGADAMYVEITLRYGDKGNETTYNIRQNVDINFRTYISEDGKTRVAYVGNPSSEPNKRGNSAELIAAAKKQGKRIRLRSAMGGDPYYVG